MAKAQINSYMLEWALNRSKADVEHVASKLNVPAERVRNWLAGEDNPTFNQASRFADILHVPFGYLYLKRSPKEKIPIPEFRRLPNVGANISSDILDLLSDIEFKRDWYREYRTEAGYLPLHFVGRFSLGDKTEIIASDIRNEMSDGRNDFFSRRIQHTNFLGRLVRACEAIGIWIMRSGVIASNSHRAIPISQLRGFAIADKTIPLIFLNGADAKAAQIFTLAHELAHIWIGSSSIEAGDIGNVPKIRDGAVEKKCNEIGAEFLVPRAEFETRWSVDVDLSEQASEVAHYFSVSRVVVVRRAMELGMITQGDFSRFYALERRRWAEDSSAGTSGGSFYNNIPSRNGRAFTNAVLREASTGRILFRDAGALLGVQPSKVREFQHRLSG